MVIDFQNFTPYASLIGGVMIGSALFGIGWGLGGLCPGPAISSLLLVPGDALLFVLMMLAGLAVGRMLTSGPAARPAAQP